MRRYVSRNSGENFYTYVGQKGELTVSPVTDEVRVHDGSTPGGIPISGSGGNPAGDDRAIQFNNSGVFGGNVNKFSFDTNGNVGIGTSSPLAILDVRDDALINGVTVGLGKGAVAGNTVFGYQAFKSNTVPYGGSTAFGYQTLYSTTSGAGIAVGYRTLRLNTTGWDNLAIGDWALENNTTGTYNQAIGHQALRNNTTGSANLSNGRFSLFYNTDGYMNHAVGMYSMYGNTSGHHNTADGYEALYTNNTGSYNSACGYQALRQNDSGNYNAAFGYRSGKMISDGNKNTVLGSYDGSGGPINVSGNNYVVLSDGDGNVRFYSDPNGNIGIGTTKSYLANRLDVHDGNIEISSYGYGIVFPDGSFQTTAGGGGGGGGGGTPAGNNRAVQFNNAGVLGGDINLLILKADGNVGISNNNPLAILDVGGDALINGITVGFGKNSIPTNTAIGYQALKSNTTGPTNTAIGYQTLYSSTDGYQNTAIGYQALYNQLGGYGSPNHAIGYQALYSTTTGFFNTASGYQALYANTTGYDNTAIGYMTLYYNTTGSFNRAVGHQALYYSTTGSWNQADGMFALHNNLTGSYNQAAGAYALYSSTTAIYTLAVGHRAGYSITTGSYNTLVGAYEGLAGPVSQTGNNYVVLSDGTGTVRLYSDPNGNVGIGTTSATVSARLGVYGGNIKVGTTGYGYVFPDGTIQTTASGGPPGGTTGAIQYNNGGTFGGNTSKFAINITSGNIGIGTASPNNLLHVQGNALITGDVTIQGTLYETSDIALKENIETITGAIDIVNKLRGVSFNWKANHNKSNGIIAQELEEIMPHLVREDETGYKSVNYTAIIGILIEAIKELSDKVEK